MATTKTKQTPILDLSVTGKLILPPATKQQQMVQATIRENLLAIPPCHVGSVYEQWKQKLLSWQFLSMIFLFGMTITMFCLNFMSLGFAAFWFAIVCGMYFKIHLIKTAKKTDFTLQDYEEMIEVAKYNPKVATYIKELRQLGREIGLDDYLHLNIPHQSKIILATHAKQRMEDMLDMAHPEQTTEISSALSKIKMEEYWQADKGFKQLQYINGFRIGAVTLFCGYFILNSIYPAFHESVEEFITLMVYLCTLITTAMATLVIEMETHNAKNNFIYKLSVYDHVARLCQYNPEIKAYIKKAVDDGRLLHEEDLRRMRIDEQFEKLKFLKLSFTLDDN